MLLSDIIYLAQLKHTGVVIISSKMVIMYPVQLFEGWGFFGRAKKS
jgi:hypothetical protein